MWEQGTVQTIVPTMQDILIIVARLGLKHTITTSIQMSLLEIEALWKNAASVFNASMQLPAGLQTACAQACPTDALVFGNLNNPNSEVSQLYDDERSYVLQESIGTQPNVRYLKKIDEHAAEEAHAH